MCRGLWLTMTKAWRTEYLELARIDWSGRRPCPAYFVLRFDRGPAQASLVDATRLSQLSFLLSASEKSRYQVLSSPPRVNQIRPVCVLSVR